MFEPGESGLLVPAGSVRSFSEAMVLLAASPELRARLGRRAAKIAEQRFGVRQMAEAYESLYAAGHSQRWDYESSHTRALAELTRSDGEQ
jgi:glycosyltransferase involved in cell wall biosynthesis